MKSTKCCLRNAERLTPWFVAHTSDGYRGLIDNPRDREKIARDLNISVVTPRFLISTHHPSPVSLQL